MRRLSLFIIPLIALFWSASAASVWAASQPTQAASPPLSTITKPSLEHRAKRPVREATNKTNNVNNTSKANKTNKKRARKKPKKTAKASSPFSELAVGQGKGPLDISSDKLSLDYKGKTVIFTGHVRALQTNGGQLTCDHLKVMYGKNFRDIDKMIADGNVRISEGTRWVTGRHAVMNQSAHTVVLTGSPVVHDGNDQITGSKITVNLDSGESVVENAHAVIFPKHSQTTDNVAVGNE